MGRTQTGYDVVVVGDGLSLLAAGLTLVRSGARALLAPLPRQLQETPIAQQQGPYLEGVDLTSLLREFGLSPAELRALAPLSPSFQLIMPHLRLELGADDDAMRLACEREYQSLNGEACKQLVDFSQQSRDIAFKTTNNLSAFTVLPPQGLRQKLRNRQALSRLHTLHKNRSWRDDNGVWGIAARALGLMLTHAVPSKPLHQGLVQQMVALARWGSIDARSLTALLKQHLQKKGADILNPGSLRSILVKRRQVQSLLLADEELVHCQTVIAATHPQRLLAYCGEERIWKKMRRWAEARPIIYDRYVIELPILREGLPVGMAPRSLLLADQHAAWTHDNLLLVDRQQSGSERTTLWVRFLVAHGEAVSPELLAKIQQRLAAVIPFLQENLLPAENAAPQLQGHLYGPAAEHRDCCLFGYAPQTPLRNLLLAGPANLPELGVEGELLSALKTSQAALLSGVKGELGGLVLERNLISA